MQRKVCLLNFVSFFFFRRWKQAKQFFFRSACVDDKLDSCMLVLRVHIKVPYGWRLLNSGKESLTRRVSCKPFQIWKISCDVHGVDSSFFFSEKNFFRQGFEKFKKNVDAHFPCKNIKSVEKYNNVVLKVYEMLYW